mmetsp:Transcript_54523/g.101986  ORF Transcript_54523/g.101986 Transcript_54523/m.101986 type:complete len:251 (+) Transcript_54523:1500-2252(+)
MVEPRVHPPPVCGLPQHGADRHPRHFGVRVHVTSGPSGRAHPLVHHGQSALGVAGGPLVRFGEARQRSVPQPLRHHCVEPGQQQVKAAALVGSSAQPLEGHGPQDARQRGLHPRRGVGHHHAGGPEQRERQLWGRVRRQKEAEARARVQPVQLLLQLLQPRRHQVNVAQEHPRLPRLCVLADQLLRVQKPFARPHGHGEERHLSERGKAFHPPRRVVPRPHRAQQHRRHGSCPCCAPAAGAAAAVFGGGS